MVDGGSGGGGGGSEQKQLRRQYTRVDNNAVGITMVALAADKDNIGEEDNDNDGEGDGNETRHNPITINLCVGNGQRCTMQWGTVP